MVLEPVGGLLAIPSDNFKYKKKPKLELNPMAVEIVKRCNGEKTCLDIVYEMRCCVRGDGFDVADAVSDFLADLGRQELIRFSDTPVQATITLVGSTEQFTPLHFSIELTLNQLYAIDLHNGFSRIIT